ncbi:uncharacterized protein G2W53_015219 [Senna tora]|uniref:Uncharacterized protein n=1 Tax=Senna tora TaxID=362788 RepID=A0A835C3X2_9FABA|nr:uncharacterized protein G2W53_015219 [Senna tora]
MATGQISRHHRLVASDLSAPSSRCIRSLGAVVSLQQILPEKTQKIFHRFLSCAASVDVVDEKHY